jgi:hypothetical protein
LNPSKTLAKPYKYPLKNKNKRRERKNMEETHYEKILV